MPTTSIIPFLQERLGQPLPGEVAQNKMSTRTKFSAAKGNTRLASVLCLLYPKNDKLYMPLMQRVITENDKHSGQISFPGGKVEPFDSSYRAAALREANEEIGVQAEDIAILGQLTPLYIPASNFKVFPFVGYLDYVPKFIPQVREVAEIIEVALAELIAPETIKYQSMQFKNGFTLKKVPYFDVNSKVVWGATGMMLSEFVEVVNQVKSSTIKKA